MDQENSNEYGAWNAEAFARLDQMDSDKWIVHKPEGAPYAGIRTKDGRTIAGTSSGLSDEHAQEICANQHNREYIKVLLGKIVGLQRQLEISITTRREMCEVDNKCLQLKSLQLTELEVAEIASRYGTINDFGKTFFTDSELYDFVHEFLQANSQRAMNVVRAVPMESGDGQA